MAIPFCTGHLYLWSLQAFCQPQSHSPLYLPALGTILTGHHLWVLHQAYFLALPGREAAPFPILYVLQHGLHGSCMRLSIPEAEALPAREPTALPLPLFQQEYMGQGSISVCVQMHLLCELSAQALSPLSTCLCSAELNLSRREDSCCCLPCGIEVQSRAGS